MTTQAYEFETPSLWQRIFLQSRVNGAAYEEEEPDVRWPWPENTYLQRRLQHVRTYQLAEAREGAEGQRGFSARDLSGWNSVSISDASSETPGRSGNRTSIDTPSEDWMWCADPRSTNR